VLVTLCEWDESYQTRVRREYIPIGYPRLAEAPTDLLEQAHDDEHAREVLVDWLADRGVRASPQVLERALGMFDVGDDWRGQPDSLPSPLGVPLASHDRETGYFASGGHLTVFTADELV
jgi:hypothetical protein